MFEQFKTRAEGVSAEVHRFATNAEALDFLVDLMCENVDLDRVEAIMGVVPQPADTVVTALGANAGGKKQDEPTPALPARRRRPPGSHTIRRSSTSPSTARSRSPT